MDRIERFEEVFKGWDYSGLLEMDQMELMENFMMLLVGVKGISINIEDDVRLNGLVWLFEERIGMGYVRYESFEIFEKMVDRVVREGL